MGIASRSSLRASPRGAERQRVSSQAASRRLSQPRIDTDHGATCPTTSLSPPIAHRQRHWRAKSDPRFSFSAPRSAVHGGAPGAPTCTALRGWQPACPATSRCEGAEAPAIAEHSSGEPPRRMCTYVAGASSRRGPAIAGASAAAVGRRRDMQARGAAGRDESRIADPQSRGRSSRNLRALRGPGRPAEQHAWIAAPAAISGARDRDPEGPVITYPLAHSARLDG